jgi:CBS domain-containing protein
MTDVTRANELPVSALVADTVARIGTDASLFDVADALSAADVGALVVGDTESVKAVVSERDLVRALSARRDPATTRAIEVATTELVWCDAAATVADVANEMMDRYLRHVLVEEDGRLVGIVSARDLLGAYAATDPSSGDDDDTW